MCPDSLVSQSARFTGEFPWPASTSKIANLPVHVSLEAFSPFIPLDAEDSGLPVAILRYRVTNPNRAAAKVSIAFSIDNPIKDPAQPANVDTRVNERREIGGLHGIAMSNPKIAADHPMNGEFALCLADPETARCHHVARMAAEPLVECAMLFWDDFSDDGRAWRRGSTA